MLSTLVSDIKDGLHHFCRKYFPRVKLKQPKSSNLIHNLILILNFFYKRFLEFFVKNNNRDIGSNSNKSTLKKQKKHTTFINSGSEGLTNRRHSFKCRIKPKINVRHYSLADEERRVGEEDDNLFNEEEMKDIDKMWKQGKSDVLNYSGNFESIEDTSESNEARTPMTYKECLRILNTDSKALYNSLVDLISIKANSESEDQEEIAKFIETCVGNLNSRLMLDKFYYRAWNILKIIFWIIVLAISWKRSSTLRKLSVSLLRRGQIQMLPYWDWTSLYYETCVIKNPYYLQESLRDDDCQACMEIQDIPKLFNVSSQEISDKFMKTDTPFIITDSSLRSYWPIFKDGSQFKISTLFDLNKFYNDHQDLRYSYPCALTSNHRKKYSGSKSLRHKLLSGSVSKFYAYWENCEKRAAKTFRKLYKRPYFLPGMAEIATPNWVFISKSFIGNKYFNIPIEATSVGFAQIIGESNILIKPKRPCDSFCSKLTDTLYPGEIIVWNDYLWNAYYSPVDYRNLSAFYDLDETLAIGMGIYWNK
ncbi:unnamed protein product [Gordionus sp. m RMFG-2023]|uniref:uncharacterized protein LOC135923583 n=1 Tax=Gordionus sp. m RMFG-2023 TaxID=3053472 RepID=UPI0030E064DB